MDQLQKALILANDECLMTNLSVRILVAPVIVSTSFLGVRIPDVVIILTIVTNNTSGTNPKVEQLTVVATGFSIYEPPSSLSPIKRRQGDIPYPHIK